MRLLGPPKEFKAQHMPAMHWGLLCLVVRSAAASLAAELWKENSATAQQSLWDPFVLSLGAGTLPKQSFATYVAQDAAFLASFADAYERAERKCGREAPPLAARCSADLRELRGVVEDELKLHKSYAETWGADLGKDFTPLAATKAYTDFLDTISRDATATAAEVVSAMVPCMTLYAALGKRLQRAGVEDDNPYGEWVATYSSSDFAAAGRQAEELLDALSINGCERCAELYAGAMRLENAFFAAQSTASDWIRITSGFRAKLEESLRGASLRAGAEMEL